MSRVIEPTKTEYLALMQAFFQVGLSELATQYVKEADPNNLREGEQASLYFRDEEMMVICQAFDAAGQKLPEILW
jgi:hypothetical protein